MTDSSSSWFSLKRFAVALGTVALGTIGGMGIPLLPFGKYLGALAGGFAVGLAFENRPLLEAGVAGVLAGLATLIIAQLGGGIIDAIIGFLGLVALKPQIILLSIVLSFGLAALGAHFGNDFRDGLTKPIEESSDHAEDL